jgi:hypothetical protein
MNRPSLKFVPRKSKDAGAIALSCTLRLCVEEIYRIKQDFRITCCLRRHHSSGIDPGNPGSLCTPGSRSLSS